MAGSKRTKLKKLVSPNSTPDPVPSVEDDGLVEDLLATLESRDPSTNVEAANVLTEVQVNAEEELEGKKKKDSKSRFKEREVRGGRWKDCLRLYPCYAVGAESCSTRSVSTGQRPCPNRADRKRNEV
jgi:hypothetical protein